MITVRVRFLCLTLIALGLLVSGYLLLRHLALVGASPHYEADVCSALFGTGCDAALRSPASIQLGFPLAGWGFVYYATLATFLLLAWSLGESFGVEGTVAALVFSLGGALVSVTLLVTMLAGTSPFCPLCAVVHTINLVLIFPLKRMTGRSIRQLIQALMVAGKYLFGGKTADPVQAKWKLLGFLTVALLAVVLYQWVLIEAISQKWSVGVAFDPLQALAAFETSAEQEIPLDAGDPTLGPPDAQVQLVVFSDFQCPGCKSFSHQITELVEGFEGKLQIFFKHFPLGTACNPFIKVDLHLRACEAAWSADAARQQGKFWEFHDALFASDLDSRQNTITLIANQLGLDLQRFEAGRTVEAAMAKVKSDIELGSHLGVNSTPAIFLNGRRVYDFRTVTLDFLIDHELRVVNK